METSVMIVLIASLMLFSILEISATPAVGPPTSREDHPWERAVRSIPGSKPQLAVSQEKTSEEHPDHDFFLRKRRELPEIPNSEFSLHRERRELGNRPSPSHNIIRKAKRQAQLPHSPEWDGYPDDDDEY
ncbi:uncharacterized protein LOC111058925 isoform X2 [Nilaparvata lugens]|uniref:uncharacterized protein LOC111058925 isoform X2 n=1 Tax=Nilaparvata lugens TaxID=108931 RepID=UPI00193D955B|nr:uncharacterized protein LOC111058925 isoform X2 [Nilaparvata lugens]